MIFDCSTLPDNPDELKKIITELQKSNAVEVRLLQERVRHLYDKLFGRKYEKIGLMNVYLSFRFFMSRSGGAGRKRLNCGSTLLLQDQLSNCAFNVRFHLKSPNKTRVER